MKGLKDFCTADDPRPIIVYALDRFLPARGGVQTYVHHLILALRERYRFVVLTVLRGDATFDDAMRSRDESSVEQYLELSNTVIVTLRLDSTARREYQALRAKENQLNRADPPGYYARRWATMRAVAALLRDAAGIVDESRIVTHAMGPWEVSLASDLIFRRARRVTTPFIHPGYWGEDAESVRWITERDIVIALTRQDASTIRETGITEEKIRIVRVPASQADRSKSTQICRSAVTFLGVGRYYKGLDLFLASVRNLIPRWPTVEFTVAGTPTSETRSLTREAADAGINVVESPSDKERDDLLDRSICVCLPSASEISPYAILEAWAHGAPVVTTDNAHMRDFVGNAGLYSRRDADSFGLAIASILANRSVSQRLASRGARRLRSLHSPARVGNQLAHLYDSLLQVR